MIKTYISWDQLLNYTQDILRQLQNDNWQPDYVVGITRGGLVPANLISQYLGCRMETLKVKLRDAAEGEACETNCWMPEDAVGYVPHDSPDRASGFTTRPSLRKKILIVDDINDSGATLDWIKRDWVGGCLPDDSEWNTVWGNNVRTAVIVNNEGSNFKNVDYCARSINKNEYPEWIVFPWENWWHR